MGLQGESSDLLVTPMITDQIGLHSIPVYTGKRTKRSPMSVCNHTSDYKSRESNLLITSMITDRHRMTRSTLTN